MRFSHIVAILAVLLLGGGIFMTYMLEQDPNTTSAASEDRPTADNESAQSNHDSTFKEIDRFRIGTPPNEQQSKLTEEEKLPEELSDLPVPYQYSDYRLLLKISLCSDTRWFEPFRGF